MTFTPETGKYAIALQTSTATGGENYQGSAYGNVLGGVPLEIELRGTTDPMPIVCLLSADINHIPMTYRVDSDFFQGMNDKFLTLS